MKNMALLLVGVLLLGVLGPGCTRNDDTDDTKIGVIVTVMPQLEFAERVGGDRLDVTVLVEEGQDPHSAQLTTGQLRDIARAKLYFTVGSGVEYEKANMDVILEQNPNMEVVDGSLGVTLIPFDPEHTLGEQAMELMVKGPYQDLEASENGTDAPSVAGGETCYNISFPGEEDNRTGVVRFRPEEDGGYVVFLEQGGVGLNFTLKNEDGDALDHNARDYEPGGLGYLLKQENYTLNFGPTTQNDTQVVILEEHEHEEEHEDDHDHGEMDPHIWNSVRNAQIMVRNLLEGLIKVDPDNAENYTRNAEAYLAELEALDFEMTEAFEPYQFQKFLIFHPSFGYLAHDYHLTQLAIEEEGKEPTPQGLQTIIDQAKAEDIKVVFVSPQYSQTQADEIADEIQGSVTSIDPLGGNYLENMRTVRTKLQEGFSEGRGS